MDTPTKLEAAKHSVRHMRATDLAAPKNDSAEARAAMATLDAYLSSFVNPVKIDGKTVCHNCGGQVDSFMHMLGAGVAYRWGIAHGEAECTGCGWPARGMHYIKHEDGSELTTLRNVFLPYHPDFVSGGPA